MYNVKKIAVGSYPKVWAGAPGYETVVKPGKVTIDARATLLDWQLRRNWAMISGGASIASYTGPNYAPDCPPEGAIDGTHGLGWGSSTDGNDAVATGNVTPGGCRFMDMVELKVYGTPSS